MGGDLLMRFLPAETQDDAPGGRSANALSARHNIKCTKKNNNKRHTSVSFHIYHPNKKKCCQIKRIEKMERTMFSAMTIHPSGTDEKTDVAKDFEHVRVCVIAVERSSSL